MKIRNVFLLNNFKYIKERVRVNEEGEAVRKNLEIFKKKNNNLINVTLCLLFTVKFTNSSSNRQKMPKGETRRKEKIIFMKAVIFFFVA